MKGSLPEVRRLVRAGADVNHSRRDRRKGVTGPKRPAIPLLTEGALAARREKEQQELHAKFPLHAALWLRRHDIATFLVQAGANVERRLGNGRTALHVAVARSTANNRAKDEALLRLLLERGAKLNTADLTGEPLLHTAAGEGRYFVPLVELLLDAGADINAQDAEGRTLLHRGIGSGGKLAELLLSKKLNVNVADKRGWTPLFHALSANKLVLAKRLVDIGAKTDHRDRLGLTALKLAARSQHAAAVKFALDLGISPNTRANDGTTALHDAALNTDCLALLLNHGANPALKDKGGQTPLDLVLAKLGEEERYCETCYAAAKLMGEHMKPRRSFRFLQLVTRKSAHARRFRELKQRLSTNKAGADTSRELFWAAQGQFERVELLLARGGADVNMKNRRNETPLWQAIEARAWVTVRALLKAGADANGAGGVPPLLLAAERGYFASAELLLKHGADPNRTWAQRNSVGRVWSGASALALAEKRGDLAMVKLLVAHGAKRLVH